MSNLLPKPAQPLSHLRQAPLPTPPRSPQPLTLTIHSPANHQHHNFGHHPLAPAPASAMQPGHAFRPLFVGGGEDARPVPGRQSGSAVADVPRYPPAGSTPQTPPGVPGFTPQGGMYPEVAVFSQFDQILPHMALLQPLHGGHGAAAAQSVPGGDDAAMGARGGMGRQAEGRVTSDYASRHQAAEQRRRTRINERLDRLRKVVPHAERANTAAFLEQVLTYIESLKKKVQDLESRLDKAEGREPGAESGSEVRLNEGEASGEQRGSDADAAFQSVVEPGGGSSNDGEGGERPRGEQGDAACADALAELMDGGLAPCEGGLKRGVSSGEEAEASKKVRLGGPD
ncbi:unnamed protein product [Ostreobium quekettii]|uniref:BHLH domain-containing protein n=1 Tax=Ostreobium quekettii TaxID=121088 RepID=A0A8S1IUD7_9CHLO|nr:unnamed protein product [Ostreobium quekettii]